jgi:hypothetical protein
LRVLVSVLVATLCGCASTVVPLQEALPPKAVLDQAVVHERAGAGAIVVRRDAAFIGSACTHYLHLDGRPVAELDVKQAVTLYVDGGEHIVSVLTRGICSSGASVEVAVNVAAGQRKSLRIGFDAGGSLVMQPTAF